MYNSMSGVFTYCIKYIIQCTNYPSLMATVFSSTSQNVHNNFNAKSKSNLMHSKVKNIDKTFSLNPK